MKTCSKDGKVTVTINDNSVELIGGEKYNDMIAAMYPQYFVEKGTKATEVAKVAEIKDVLLTEVSNDVTNDVVIETIEAVDNVSLEDVASEIIDDIKEEIKEEVKSSFFPSYKKGKK